MLVGNPGKIDRRIPPDKVTNIDDETYDNICEMSKYGGRYIGCNIYEIEGTEIHLFNITGNTFVSIQQILF